MSSKKQKKPHPKISHSEKSMRSLIHRMPLPNRSFREFVYADPVSLLSDGFVAWKTGTEIVFNLNSIFAPRTSGGHQPYGRDQLAALYQRYKVHHVKVEITLLPQLVTTSVRALAMSLQTPEGGLSTTGLDVGFFDEKPGSEVFWQDSRTRHIVREIPIHTLCSVNQDEFNANTEDFAALVSASPAKIPTLHLSAASTDANGTYTYFTIKLTYLTELFGLILQASS